MADEEVKVEPAPERKLVNVRLKKTVVETPNKVRVNVNGEEFKFSSESVTEAPDFVLHHLGAAYELLDDKGVVLPPEAPKVEAEVDVDKDGKAKRNRSTR